MAATASPPQSPETKPSTAAAPFDPRHHELLRAELDAARHRWLTEGDSAECVAAYAHALLALVDDTHPSS